jgi:tRNA pseudouridine13 synthase
MKLKQSPDDFQVQERTDVTPRPAGRFAFYRLEKRGWSTPDAVAAVVRRWRLEPGRLSYGGLKDRHAWTTQHLTIAHGPRRGLHHHAVTLHYLGQIDQPFTSHDIRCNAFRLTLRDLAAADQQGVAERLTAVKAEGVPNYFDDQRFGSVDGAQGEFVARLMVQGRFEDALRLALAGPYEHDRPEQKQEKQILIANWGDWATCKTQLPRSHARSLVDYLRVHPSDFRGAAARLRPELRGLYLSAYQSYLWNRILAHWLRAQCSSEQLIHVKLRLGEMPMHRGLDEDHFRRLAALRLPLPTARQKLADDDPRSCSVNAVLAEEGLQLRDLQIRGVREMFFSKGDRAALCLPREMSFAFDQDERHRSRLKLQLFFELPRGAYATLIVKRVMAAA